MDAPEQELELCQHEQGAAGEDVGSGPTFDQRRCLPRVLDRESQIVRAEAERRRTELIAKSLSDAQRIRGEGDGLAAAIYATAYNKNPEFYAFYRSLQAYRSALGREGDVMVISPDSEFFRYLKSPTPNRR